MASFKVVLLDHGYATTNYERSIIEAAGGEFIDAEPLGLNRGLQLAEESDAVLCRRLQITPAIIRRFQRCRIILRYGVGTDNIDTQEATEAGIMVGHVPGYCRNEVAEHTLALLLTCARRIVGTNDKLQKGGWDVHRCEPIYRIAGKTLGIMGFGNIGRAVAQRVKGWQVRLLACDPFVDKSVAENFGIELVPFEQLLQQSDMVTLHCPLLPETRHLMGTHAFAQMKRGAILINTSRGSIVNEAALCERLDASLLAAAGLDVFEEEPLPPQSRLRTRPNVVLTDHTAWYSEDSQIELQETAAQTVVTVCRGGLPESLANPEVLHRLGRWQEWKPGECAQWQLKRLSQQSH